MTFIAINAYIKKSEQSQMSNLMMPLETPKQNKPQISRRQKLKLMKWKPNEIKLVL
jgi:hypothetical protein